MKITLLNDSLDDTDKLHISTIYARSVINHSSVPWSDKSITIFYVPILKLYAWDDSILMPVSSSRHPQHSHPWLQDIFSHVLYSYKTGYLIENASKIRIHEYVCWVSIVDSDYLVLQHQ